MTLDAQIEAILFFRGEPISIKKLASILGVREDTIKEALKELKQKLAGRGLVVLENGEEVTMGTAKEASDLIETLRKEELSRDLGRAGLETLSIVLYRGPISRPDIDYIRGVNSSFIVRNLLVRGLIERQPHPTDSRSFLYQPSLELLAYLGVGSVSELPEYEIVKDKVENFISQIKAEDEEASFGQNSPETNNVSN